MFVNVDPVARRWAASAEFLWPPALTFGDKKARFLQWSDQQLSPTAFTEDSDHVGLSFGRRERALRFDRQKVQLHLRTPTSRPKQLSIPVDGFWQHMQPKQLIFAGYFASWFCPAGDKEYDSLRRGFAQRITGNAVAEELGTPYDAAALINIESEFDHFALEYGVVTAEELAERIARPQIGMLKTAPGYRSADAPNPDLLPPTSLFFDVYISPAVTISGPNELLTHFEAVEARVTQVAQAVARTV